jgi:hypothetical protein
LAYNLPLELWSENSESRQMEGSMKNLILAVTRCAERVGNGCRPQIAAVI